MVNVATQPQTLDTPVISVHDLAVSYDERPVVEDVSFTVERGKSLSIIGQSGSGKSTIGRAILRLLPSNGAIRRGRAEFGGRDILALPDREFRKLRGRDVGFVPQDPQNALNRVRTVGSQAFESAKLLGGLDRSAQRERILETFARVGLQDPERAFDSYPHQLSGGQLQRVLIGLTVLPEPKLIIADEPTSALDVTIQKVILDLLGELQHSHGISLVLITHDLAVASERTDDVLVLRDGRVQEYGDATSVFESPRTDYTTELQRDVPALNPHRFKEAFPRTAARESAEPPVQVVSVSKTFSHAGKTFAAVDDVSFSIQQGRTHALVGESGSGKTTLARLLLGLTAPDDGQINVFGENLAEATPARLRETWRNLQLVYQNPFTSLDPAWSVARIIDEPLRHYGVGSRSERRQRVSELLGHVGLDDAYGHRKATTLSGGQRQRVAIARALALDAKVLVLDEPTSALDVSVQADIVEVLFRLQAELGLSYLFVSHDLSLVRQIADSVTVLRAGKAVESGSVETVLHDPQDAYTQRLIDAIPHPRVAVPL